MKSKNVILMFGLLFSFGFVVIGKEKKSGWEKTVIIENVTGQDLNIRIVRKNCLTTSLLSGNSKVFHKETKLTILAGEKVEKQIVFMNQHPNTGLCLFIKENSFFLQDGNINGMFYQALKNDKEMHFKLRRSKWYHFLSRFYFDHSEVDTKKENKTFIRRILSYFLGASPNKYRIGIPESK